MDISQNIPGDRRRKLPIPSDVDQEMGTASLQLCPTEVTVSIFKNREQNSPFGEMAFRKLWEGACLNTTTIL